MIIMLPVSKGNCATVSVEDADLADYNWTFKDGYALRKINRKGNAWMHRIIMERVVGRSMIIQECVDHIDGNGLNNCRSNLRIATQQQNMYNRKATAWHGYKGITLYKGRWYVRLHVEGKDINFGGYDTAEEAALVYNEAAKKYYGDFAWLNIVPGKVT